MSKMWPSPIFKKTYFSGRKCRKYAGKTVFLAISRDFIISFFQFFAQRCILAMLITWPSPIFDKKFFPAENTGNMPEKPVSWHFLEISSLVFLIFCTKMCISNAHNMAESDFWEKFFPAENAGNMPEIAVFADFHWTFFPYISLFFHLKTLLITMPTIKHGSFVN